MPVDETLKKISEFYEQNKSVHMTLDNLRDFYESTKMRELNAEEKRKIRATEIWKTFSKHFSYTISESAPKDKRDADKKLYDALCGQTVTAVLFGRGSVFLQFMNGTHIWISRGVIKTGNRESFPIPRKKPKKEMPHVI